MSKLKKIAFIVQSRLNSERVPGKMIRPFANKSLFEIALDKLVNSTIIPKDQIYASVNESELVDIALAKKINIFKRSFESANNDNDIKIIFEWYNKLPYEYVIIISACNPLLKISTIDNFVKTFTKQKEDNLFGVVEKKQYYWNKEGILVTPWPEGNTLMNTKAVEATYEAGHVLYASKMNLISNDMFMGDYTKPGGIKLFKMDELETFDIDYEWEFEVGELLYKKLYC
jgi:CMP-N-acetylneuraminic acid synthetase|tara:strand:+ start:1943 stop:2629 length:687 start_codon:yes stop_codon:yes gene_type:complete